MTTTLPLRSGSGTRPPARLVCAYAVLVGVCRAWTVRKYGPLDLRQCGMGFKYPVRLTRENEHVWSVKFL